MAELEQLKAELNPTEILFVADAMTGQDAVKSAQAFHERLGMSGVILTKMDGDARGGAALSIRQVIGRPLKFVGVGEKSDQFELFYPERIVSRILGMGDVLSLIEKVEETIDKKDALEMQEKILENEFTLEDFLKQLKSLKSWVRWSRCWGCCPTSARSRSSKGRSLTPRRWGAWRRSSTR
jgi:signal recognition particle subunit SRP54